MNTVRGAARTTPVTQPVVPPEGRVVTRSPSAREADPMSFARRRRIRETVLRFGAPTVFLLGWQALSASGSIDERFWPAPTRVLSEARTMLGDGVLGRAILDTVHTLAYGYVIGAVVGIVLGLVFAGVRSVRVAFEPLLTALYSIPKLAILPLLLLVFGLNDKPKIILIALTVFFITWISTMSAVMGVPATYREAATSLEAGRLRTASHVIMPAALPEIFVALRIGASLAVLTVVATEMVHGDEGLGYLIWNSWQVFFTERMYVGIVTVALLGLLFQTAVKWLARIVCPWATERNDRAAT